jgi:hypothetical protein
MKTLEEIRDEEEDEFCKRHPPSPIDEFYIRQYRLHRQSINSIQETKNVIRIDP